MLMGVLLWWVSGGVCALAVACWERELVLGLL